jgi:hypothetical protein
MNAFEKVARNILQTVSTPAVGLLCMLLLNTGSALAAERDMTRRHSVGTSAFMLADLLPESPQYILLDYGYRLTKDDVVMVEAITWKYPAPLGIPLDSSGSDYPGYIKSYGAGLAYQRFLWEGLYAKVHAAYLRTHYSIQGTDRVQEGNQLFVQFRVGYHFEFPVLGERLYLEPSVAATGWPINTNVPASFAAQDKKYPSYGLEPGLNFGMVF